MITLYQFPPAFGILNGSPFCMKVEVFLKMKGLEYQTKSIPDPRKAPHGKLPYIKDEGEIIADSACILEHLASKNDKLSNEGYSPRDLAIGDAVVKMLEEHYYWAQVYSRWLDDRYWDATKKEFFSSLPLPLQFIIPPIARKSVKTQLFQQGTSRHHIDKIYQLGINDINTTDEILGDNDFIIGPEPTVYDASVYAFIANALDPEPNTPLKQHIKTKPRLVAYCERMRARYLA